MKKYLIAAGLVLACQCALAVHAIKPTNKAQYQLTWRDRIYVGVTVGYGNTNWGRLVSKDAISSINTPKSGGGSGVAYGVDAGYYLMKYLAAEVDYMHLPSARVQLNVNANGYNPVYGLNNAVFYSHTDWFAGLFKIFVPIYDCGLSAFSDLGVAYTWRHDKLANKGNVRPTFGIGLTYLLKKHWLMTGQFQFTPGTGASTVTPVLDYIPYLYTGTASVAYLF